MTTPREAFERARQQFLNHDAVCQAADTCVKCSQLASDLTETERIWRNSRFHWLTTAGDTFRNGGTLVDTPCAWAMRDKVQHLVGGLLLARITAIIVAIVLHHDSVVSRARYTMTVVVMAALLNEGAEVFRMYRWWHRTSLFRAAGWEWHWDEWRWSHPDPNTGFTMQLPASPLEWADSFSWRDVLATVVGGAIGL